MSFADRATAREAVDYLNELFGLVIPLLTRHGGQGNKLLGDGLLGAARPRAQVLRCATRWTCRFGSCATTQPG